MRASEIISILESVAPLHYQESYDNSGIQVGEANTEITGVLFSLDITEPVLEEALARGCNMIIAHHPIIFGGLKKLSGRNYVERVVMKAIRHNLVLYASHTNLDNIRTGVNAQIAERIGLKQTRILQPMGKSLKKLYTYIPSEQAEMLRNALFAAGAGAIGNYTECSFSCPGTGTFRPGPDASPSIGTAGGQREAVNETKIEVLVPVHLENQVLKALFDQHPYETVAYELIDLANVNQELGAGMIGDLEPGLDETAFLKLLIDKMECSCVRHSPLLSRPIRKVALCGGSGSFLLKDAIRAGADVFVTGDYKYHQFFDAEDQILIADIGHYESEQFTPQLLLGILAKKLPNFALLLSGTKTNPVNYFF